MTPQPVAAPFVEVTPRILVGPRSTPLAASVEGLVENVVVDLHAHLPGMFEITFADRDGSVLDRAGLAIGTQVALASVGVADKTSADLVVGEITAIEGDYGAYSSTTVRGYTRDHRLQRARRTRTFLNVKDSDIAKKIAREHGLAVGRVDQTTTAHEHVGQVNQTDWEFLRSRADAIGFEFGVVDGKFHFTRPVAASSAVVVGLSFPTALLRFSPRVTAGNLAPQTEVRVWDPRRAKAVAAVVTTETGNTRLDDADPAALSRPFQPRAAGPKPAAAGRDLGPDPVAAGFVVSGVPAANGAAADTAAREVAQGAARRLGSTVAEAEGEAVGNPRLRPGVAVEVDGVAGPFRGRWVLTRTTHRFATGRYTTTFEISGANDRSLLALGGGTPTTASIPGVVCGVVSNIGDPDGKGRVRLTLPWLSPRFETGWAVVAHPGAGTRGGAVLQPAVGDQVLVAFEFGDPRRPYVLGGLYDDRAAHDLGGPPVKRSGSAASVVWRGIVTPTGNRLAFHDEQGPGAKPSTVASDFVLGTAGADLALVVDQVAGTVTLRCAPAPSGGRPAKPGKLTIQCGDRGVIDVVSGKGGKVNVTAGAGGEVNVGGGARLNLTGKASVKIESSGPVEIKGHPIKLN
ncbi:VgrG-related protein [Umezawaea endophytica]|uniref:VgrG-related protein n=1 Tax=Umezawaea endophytica TaxID=1654476 RepID=A0A9X2VID5_9PSEU|nr:VgrG-related protein [Umezawaea endophytica]MCS7477116.1 VgrG-related protein [Umezawaea endophytica]